MTRDLALLENPSARAGMSLETILIMLSKFGRIRLGQYATEKWHCQACLHVTVAGAKFDVDSTFNHDTPVSAARECAERVVLAMAATSTRKP